MRKAKIKIKRNSAIKSSDINLKINIRYFSLLFKYSTTEMMKYNEMIIHHASNIPKAITQNTDKAIKQYLTLLPFQPHCLNLSANIGSSDISR